MDQVKELQEELREQYRLVLEEVRKPRAPEKDLWDRLAAVAPIVSGLLIASMGFVCTYSYNQQQIRLQEVQTIEKFIPHLSGSEKSKKAAILAMSSLANTELAARFASLFASEGTVSALQSIAASGDNKERTVATKALSKALDNIAERYWNEGRLADAEEALTRALTIKQRLPATDNREILHSLDRLCKLYLAQGKSAQAEPLLRRAMAIRQQAVDANDPELARTMRQLAEICQTQGRSDEAKLLTKQAQTAANSASAPGQDDIGLVEAGVPGIEAETQNGLSVKGENELDKGKLQPGGQTSAQPADGLPAGPTDQQRPLEPTRISSKSGEPGKMPEQSRSCAEPKPPEQLRAAGEARLGEQSRGSETGRAAAHPELPRNAHNQVASRENKAASEHADTHAIGL